VLVIRRRTVQIVREDERGLYLSAPLEIAQFIQSLEFIKDWRGAYAEVKRLILERGVGQHEVELRVVVSGCAPALEVCVDGSCRTIAVGKP